MTDYSKLTPAEFVEAVRKDPEMDRWLLSLLLEPGQEIFYLDEDTRYDIFFLGLSKTYYGRLHNPGTKPGLYFDHTKAIIERNGAEQTVPIERLVFGKDHGYDERVEKLPKNWHLIDLSRHFVEELPATKFMESDVVRLTEDHADYSENPDDNQYTVYKICYDSTEDRTYTLRAGKTLLDANESQLSHVADGPIRIMQTREHPLNWRSLKDEAEFHLLIGQYQRVFNPHNLSYRWDLTDPQHLETIVGLRSSGFADGILARKGYDELVIFDDRAVGAQVAAAPDLVLDI